MMGSRRANFHSQLKACLPRATPSVSSPCFSTSSPPTWTQIASTSSTSLVLLLFIFLFLLFKLLLLLIILFLLVLLLLLLMGFPCAAPTETKSPIKSLTSARPGLKLRLESTLAMNLPRQCTLNSRHCIIARVSIKRTVSRDDTSRFQMAQEEGPSLPHRSL